MTNDTFPYTLGFQLHRVSPPAVIEELTAGLTDLEQLNYELLHGDPISRADAAEKLASSKTVIDTTWTVTVYDKLWRPVATVGDDMMELSGTDPRNNLPTALLKLKGDSTLIGIMETCQHTMVGVTVETAGLRFAYYVDTFDYEFADGAWVGIAHLNGIWDILNYLQIWPNFLFPIQVQIPSHAIFIWALQTVVECMISECALRIQSGLWEFVNNALSLNPDIRAWFGTLLQSNGNILDMLKCPVYVVHTNPFLDTSPLVARTVRMESCATVIRDVTRAYGVDVRVDLWLPGDEQPDQWTKTISWLALDQPTYVVTCKDRSQITGPTGTILDSVLRTVVDLGGTFLSDIIPGLFQQIPSMEGVYISPMLGVNWVPPWAVLVAPETGHKGSVVSCKLSYHTPKGWQHIIGGRSPKWLNDLINAFTAWLIDSVSILLGFTGIPSDLLSGFLNNAFLAFQLIEHYGRRNQVGPYHPGIEVFHATSSAPYNIECVSGDTVIDGPDGKERIDVLAARGGPFQVWSITPDGDTVPATALCAFKKGRAELFQFTLADDRRISVTKDHKFLTDHHYIPAGQLHIGSLIATIDGLQPVTHIQALGVDDFYDMHVPGWENYLAHGIWNHNTLFGFVNALWDSRGWVSCVTKFRNAEVYTLGKDIFRGGLVSVLYPAAGITTTGQTIIRKKLYTDYIENVAFHVSEDLRDVILQIGDGKAKESPLAKHQRFITGVLESINVITLAPQSAGFL